MGREVKRTTGAGAVGLEVKRTTGAGAVGLPSIAEAARGEIKTADRTANDSVFKDITGSVG